MGTDHIKIAEVVHKYHKNILILAFTYTKNIQDAEDIAQDVFLELWKRQPDFESEEHRKAWLLRVTVNKSKNLLKSFWKRNRGHFVTESGAMAETDLDLIQAVISLDKKYRLPIHLFYYEGYSIREIAELLHEKETTIGTRLERGRKKLKEMLGGDYYG